MVKGYGQVLNLWKSLASHILFFTFSDFLCYFFFFVFAMYREGSLHCCFFFLIGCVCCFWQHTQEKPLHVFHIVNLCICPFSSLINFTKHGCLLAWQSTTPRKTSFAEPHFGHDRDSKIRFLMFFVNLIPRDQIRGIEYQKTHMPELVNGKGENKL